MARQIKQKQKSAGEIDESLVRVFFRGFLWPLKTIGQGLAWLVHQPPLKQTGHALSWFARLRAVRFAGRLLGMRYIYTSWQELRDVTWPSRSEGRRLTTAVILFAIVFGALVAGVDWGLDKIFKQLLLK